MNFRLRLLVFTVLLFPCATCALADPVSNTLNISGHDSFTPSSLTFITPFASSNDTGVFSSFNAGNVTYDLGTVNPLDVVFSLQIFSITAANGDLITFTSTDNTASEYIDPTTGYLDLTSDETGFYSIDGGPDMAGYFDVTFYGMSTTGAVDAQFLGSGGLGARPRVAPEPSSSLLLGTSMLAIAGGAFFSRRRLIHRTA